MDRNFPVRTGGLDVTRLRFADYTRSLLDEAFRCGLMNESDIARVQGGFLDSLGELIRLYTEGLSSSVSNDLAEEFLKSLLYCTDAALISLASPTDALSHLKESTIFEIYTDGLKVLRRHVYECTGLLVKLRRTRVNLPLKLYNDTLDKTLTKALRTYDPKFAAHRLKFTLDYPTAAKRSRLRGIYQVRSYVDSLIAENTLCREFEPFEIMKLYKTFCDRDISGYREPSVNIFSMLLPNAVIAEYLKKDPGTLTLTYSDCTAAEKLLSAFEDADQKEILKNAATKVCYSDPAYGLKAFDEVLPGLINALKHNRLANYLVVDD